MSEGMNNEYTYQIPSYALSYIYNGDDSGLEQDDIDNIDAFLAREHYIDTWDILDESEYFCTTPEFGLPCNVVDVVGVQFANS
jgi:hypothetical protein